MSERVAIPIYWGFESCENYIDILIRNLKVLNEDYLNKGWEIERVNELKDSTRSILIYILKKENN